MSWEINGVTYDTPEVELNARTAGTDGRIIAKLNTKLSETTDAPLQIKEISTAKKAGYIVLSILTARRSPRRGCTSPTSRRN